MTFTILVDHPLSHNLFSITSNCHIYTQEYTIFKEKKTCSLYGLKDLALAQERNNVSI